MFRMSKVSLQGWRGEMSLPIKDTNCGKWERHRQGQARLWMGVGAICNDWFYFGKCLLGVFCTTRKVCEQHMPMPCGLGSS